MIILQILLATFILWLCFIPTTNIVNRHREKKYTGWRKWLGYTWVWFFVLLDVIYNYTYAAILFLQLASNDRKTFTARLKFYLQTEPDSWRGRRALFFCKYLIEPFDRGHCALQMVII